jgi:hypothetical protein
MSYNVLPLAAPSLLLELFMLTHVWSRSVSIVHGFFAAHRIIVRGNEHVKCYLACDHTTFRSKHACQLQEFSVFL